MYSIIEKDKWLKLRRGNSVIEGGIVAGIKEAWIKVQKGIVGKRMTRVVQGDGIKGRGDQGAKGLLNRQ